MKPEPTLHAPRTRPLPPVAAAVVVFALAALLVIAWRWTGEAPRSEPARAPGARASVSSEDDAIQQFLTLDAARQRAFESRDVQELREVFMAESPALRRIEESIGQLRADGVTADEFLQRKNVELISMTERTIRLRDTIVFGLRFHNQDGRDVSSTQIRERRVLIWELRKHDGEWRLYKSVLVDARPL